MNVTLTGSIEGVWIFGTNFTFHESTSNLAWCATIFIPYIFRVWNVAVIYIVWLMDIFSLASFTFFEDSKPKFIDVSTQLVTTRGSIHGTVLSSLTISLHVAFLYWLSALYFGPSHVNLKQYGRSTIVLFSSSISTIWHKTQIVENKTSTKTLWFIDIFHFLLFLRCFFFLKSY